MAKATTKATKAKAASSSKAASSKKAVTKESAKSKAKPKEKEEKVDQVLGAMILDTKIYGDFAKEIARIGKAYDMETVSLVPSMRLESCSSTGIHAVNLILGGGFAGGRFISPFGAEQSGKSTLTYETVAECCLLGIPTIFGDAEQATDPSYLARIIKKKTGKDITHFMGEKDTKGNYTKLPLLYYIQPNNGEDFMNMVVDVLNKLPSVVYEDGKWWEGHPVPNRKKERKWIERAHGRPQCLILMDSLPMFLPKAREEDKESNPIAQVARMYNDNMGKLLKPIKRTNSILVYTNQLKINPQARFGNPETEPCGNTPKFLSSVRMRMGSLAPGSVKEYFPNSSKEPTIKEPSWDGAGEDVYRFSKMKTTKNKTFSPYQECVMRFRLEAKGEQGDGICPTFDAYMYYLLTGQCSRVSKGKLEVSLLGTKDGKDVSSALAKYLTTEGQLTWLEFKRMVEDPANKKAVDRHIRSQFESGYAFELYFATKAGDYEVESEDEGEED